MMATEKRLISLDEALEATHKEVWWTESEASAIRSFLLKLPRADAVEVVHGRWEDCSDKFDKGMDLRCLVCGGRADSFVGGSEDWYCLWKPNFCPHCGAKMDGDGNG